MFDAIKNYLALANGVTEVTRQRALSAAKALVCAETVGTSAFLRDGENALIVAGPRVDTIADALLALARDPQLRRRLGRGARQVFEANFTHSAFQSSLLDALTTGDAEAGETIVMTRTEA